MRLGSGWILIFLALAGGCDATTGLLLIAAPDFTLDLMQIAMPPSEPIYTRFIGVFVMSMGLSYFLPFFYRPEETRATAVRMLLAFTALVRVCVATFILSSVVLHALAPMWLSVFATDAGLASFQLFILRKASASKSI